MARELARQLVPPQLPGLDPACVGTAVRRPSTSTVSAADQRAVACPGYTDTDCPVPGVRRGGGHRAVRLVAPPVSLRSPPPHTGQQLRTFHRHETGRRGGGFGRQLLLVAEPIDYAPESGDAVEGKTTTTAITTMMVLRTVLSDVCF